MAGIYEPKHVLNPDYFIGLSFILIGLYKTVPGVSWYGFFLFLLLAMSYCNLVYVTYNFLVFLKPKRLWQLVPGVLVFCGFMQEFIMRNTFTTAACLLTGSATLLMVFRLGPAFALYIGLCILLGLLTRLEIAVITLLLASSLTLVALWFQNKKAIIQRLLPVVILPLFMSNVLKWALPTSETIDFGKFSFYESLIQDAYILPISSDIKDPATQLKLEAITTWNHFDADILTEDWLHNLYAQPHNFEVKQFLYFKTLNLIQFADRYQGRQSCFNWLYKEIVLFMINLVLIVAFGPILLGLRKTVLLSVLWLLAGVLILLIALIAKMEDRLLGPYLLILTVFNLYTFAAWSNKKWKSIYIVVLVIPLCCFSAYRAKACIKMSELLMADKIQKQKFIAELNSFNHKIILFDLYTAYFVDTGPFCVPNLNKENQYVLPFHYISRHFKSNIDYWTNKCGSANSNKILNCLNEKSDQVVFIYNTYNISFLHRWNVFFYNDTINFCPVYNKSVLRSYKNPFLWGNQAYSYYIIKRHPDLNSN
ncbi:MAG: hypothetical protein U0V74_12140 [Chitinophagales bacterium]